MSDLHPTTTPSRLAHAVVRLLDASEAAMTRGSTEFAITYATKAAEATDALRDLANEAIDHARPRRITKAESQYGRLM